MQSLKDKLVLAGLVAKDYKPPEPVKPRAARPNPPEPRAQPKDDEPVEEPAEKRSARMNKDQAALRLRIAAIVVGGRVETKIGEHTFFFTTRSKKLRRLVIEEAVKTGLEKGEYAVVEWPNQPDFPWAVVPRAVAERILGIDPVAVRFFLKSEQEQYGVEASTPS